MQVKKINENKTIGAVTVEWIIGLSIGLLVCMSILPTIFATFFNYSVTGWDSTTRTIWALLPVVVIVTIIMVVYRGR